MGFLMDVFLASFAVIRPKRDDDGTDRLHYFVTSNMLVGLAVLTGYKMIKGNAVKCMMPDFGFREDWMDFVDNYCWIQGTYFMPQRVSPTPSELHAKGSFVHYYQWVPMFLLFEAACFCVPRMFWNSSCHGSGIRISDIVDMSRDKANFKADIRNNTINILSTHLRNALAFHKRIERRNLYKWFRPGSLKYTACYVTIIYLFTKILFFINALVQFEIMNLFLFNNTSGAINVLRRNPWNTTGFFPRVSYCVVPTRSVGSRVQNHTIQCVLTINLFNEKIFFFLWFWYLFLMILTALSTLYWSLVLLLPQFAKRYMLRHLKLADQPFIASENEFHLNKFVKHYLQQDGVLVLRMVSLHTGVIFATQLVLKLWNDYFGFQSIEETKEADVKEGDDDDVLPKVVERKTDVRKDGLLDMEVLDRKIDKLAMPMTSPRGLQKLLQDEDSLDELEQCEEGYKRDEKKKLGGGQQQGPQQRPEQGRWKNEPPKFRKR